MHERSVLCVVALVAALLVGTTAAASPGPASQAGAAPAPAQLRGIYDAGVTFDRFLETADRQRRRWQDNYGRAEPASDLLARARALRGTYHLLAVSVAGCSDSVNTVPYLAGLVREVDNLDLHIVDSDAGRLLMDTYRTPDDRGATPTVVVLDESFAARGAWVERPAALQQWWLSHPEISVGEKVSRKQGWYDWDQGYQTLREVIELLEAADAAR